MTGAQKFHLSLLTLRLQNKGALNNFLSDIKKLVKIYKKHTLREDIFVGRDFRGKYFSGINFRDFDWNFQSIATSTVQPFVAEYLRKKYSDLMEVASDNNYDKDDDYANNKVVEIRTGEALKMLDRLVNLR